MHFQANTLPITAEAKILSKEFPVSYQTYTQHYQKQNTLHYHDCFEIGLCIQGNGTEMINNHVYPFESNSISIIQSGCIHDSHIFMQNPEEIGSTWKFIFVNPEAFGLTCQNFGGFLSTNSQLVSLFHMMFQELEEKAANYQELFQKLLSAFLLCAERIAPLTAPVCYADLSPEMSYVIQRIHTSYKEDLSVSSLAKECNMSESSFYRTFKSCFGMPPLTYINNVRLTIAQHLLETTHMPILTISSEIGFQSVSSFNRLFQKHFGISPRNMRQRHTHRHYSSEP